MKQVEEAAATEKAASTKAAEEEAIKEAVAKKVAQENPSQEASETETAEISTVNASQKQRRSYKMKMKHHTPLMWVVPGENSLQTSQMMTYRTGTEQKVQPSLGPQRLQYTGEASS